jgi:shikimate dehydrogenase
MGAMIDIALIGSGIQGSLTPPLHEAEAAALGIAYRYAVWEADDVSALGALLSRAEAEGLRGLNVTHPFKQRVVEHLDELSPRAQQLGAVNTVVFEDGRRIGHNTDWPGFAESFRRGLPDASVGDVVIVGAGGAGHAVAHAAVELGARRLSIVDADEARAVGLAAALPNARVAGLAEALEGADGLIHATPVGMVGHPGLAVDPDLLEAHLWVADVVYRPLATPLLLAAQARGCRTLDGGGMAVFQAVEAFALFTGIRPDAERMLTHFTQLV